MIKSKFDSHPDLRDDSSGVNGSEPNDVETHSEKEEDYPDSLHLPEESTIGSDIPRMEGISDKQPEDDGQDVNYSWYVPVHIRIRKIISNIKLFDEHSSGEEVLVKYVEELVSEIQDDIDKKRFLDAETLGIILQNIHELDQTSESYALAVVKDYYRSIESEDLSSKDIVNLLDAQEYVKRRGDDAWVAEIDDTIDRYFEEINISDDELDEVRQYWGVSEINTDELRRQLEGIDDLSQDVMEEFPEYVTKTEIAQAVNKDKKRFLYITRELAGPEAGPADPNRQLPLATDGAGGGSIPLISSIGSFFEGGLQTVLEDQIEVATKDDLDDLPSQEDFIELRTSVEEINDRTKRVSGNIDELRDEISSNLSKQEAYEKIDEVRSEMAKEEALRETKSEMATGEELDEIKSEMATGEELDEVRSEIEGIRTDMMTQEELEQKMNSLPDKSDIKELLEETLE